MNTKLINSLPITPIQCSIKDLDPIEIIMVDNNKWESLWNYIIREFHYLGFGKMMGARIKYLIISGERLIAAVGFKSAFLKLKPRDVFFGWSNEQRKKHLPQVINNNRFLILPGVRVKNLGSYLLSKVIQKVKEDWYQKYNYKPLLLETFVDPKHFDGIIYQAANWIKVGETSGYTKKGSEYKYHGDFKDIYLYIIEPKFRQVIGCEKENQQTIEYLRQHPLYSAREEFIMLLGKLDWNPKLLRQCGVYKENVQKLGQKLLDYHQYFEECYVRPEQIEYAVNYLKGLMAKDIPRKNVSSIAERIYIDNDSKVRSMQRHLTEYRWDSDLMMDKYQIRLSQEIAIPEGGMITVDESGIRKDGKSSAGVHRQYCGNLGKVENCQVGVYVGYTSPLGYGLADCQLYMPEIWFSDEYKKRREQNRVPEDLEFMTKPEIAQKLIEQIQEKGLFPAKWLGCDAVYGSDHDFLDAVALYYWYLASVKANTQVWLERPEVGVPAYEGRGRKPSKKIALTPSLAISVIANKSDLEWKKVILGEGAHGPIEAEIARIRVIESRDKLPGNECWLILRKQNNEIKYYICNAPKEVPFEEMVKAVIMRWPIEQSFKEGKDLLGMDEYECRSWPGWHRHMTYVFLAMLFLLEVRKEFKKKDEDNSIILTVAMARELVLAALSMSPFNISDAIRLVNYTLKNYYKAYKHHRKKKIEKLKKAGYNCRSA